MSAFYGAVEGNRGPATRGGSKNSGFKSTCQSYDGSVITRMRYDSDDKLQIMIDISDDSSAGWGADEMFRGSLSELKTALSDFMKKKNKRAAK